MSFDKIIFFDLETSSLHRVGQILNFCFIVIDKSWNELARFKGDIGISRIELPDPMSIQSTAIDVLEHQKLAHLSEKEAAHQIRAFLNKWGSNKTALSGYNTEDFDIPFIRTTLFRNGLYEYTSAVSRDLMIFFRYIIAKNQEFKAHYFDFLKGLNPEAETPKMSITLEKVATFLGILKDDQAHESEFDVDLVIAVAKKLATSFNENIFEFNPYGLASYHKPNGEVLVVESPARSFNENVNSHKLIYIKTEGNASLWTHVKDFKEWVITKDESKLPLKRLKHESANFWYVSKSEDTEEKEIGETAVALLQKYSTKDMYPKKDVYIEQWTYDLLAEDKKLLFACISGDSNQYRQLSTEAMSVYRRYLIASTTDEECFPAYEDIFTRYCIYRYGGGMKLFTEFDRHSKDRPITHLTFQQLLDEFPKAYELVKTKKNSTQCEKALASLMTFYDQSRIKKALSL